MSFKLSGEHIIILALVVALLYSVSKHYNLLSDLSKVPHDNNPQLKIVKDKHSSRFEDSILSGDIVHMKTWEWLPDPVRDLL